MTKFTNGVNKIATVTTKGRLFVVKIDLDESKMSDKALAKLNDKGLTLESMSEVKELRNEQAVDNYLVKNGFTTKIV
jgi:hypothetical protein